jgi:hypothetical protein
MQFLPEEIEAEPMALTGEPISDKGIERLLANIGGVPLGISSPDDCAGGQR